MKTYNIVLRKILLLLCLPPMLYGCWDDDVKAPDVVIPVPDVYLVDTEAVLPSDMSYSATVAFTTNLPWRLEKALTRSTPDWFEVDMMHGDAGEVTLIISATQENELYDDRNALIKIVVGGEVNGTINVTQKKKDAIIASRDKVELGLTDTGFAIDLQANVAYEVVIPEEHQSWIFKAEAPAGGTRGLESHVEYFTVAAPTVHGKREGEVIFRSGDTEEVVSIYQVQEDLLILSESSAVVTEEGIYPLEVSLRANIEYEVVIPDDCREWITQIAPPLSRAVRNDVLYFNIEPYDGLNRDNKEVCIVFKAIGCDLSDTFTITQWSSLYGIYDADDMYELAAELKNQEQDPAVLRKFGRFDETASQWTFRLQADVDMNPGTTFAADGTYAGAPAAWQPIGSEDSPFNEVFIGNGYTISGLFVNNSSLKFQGLFGVLGDKAKVSNLTIGAGYIAGNEYNGSLCGSNAGLITECTNYAYVQSRLFAGGLCGINKAEVALSKNNGKVVVTDNGGYATDRYAGGIAGFNSGGTFTQCENHGEVTSIAEDTYSRTNHIYSIGGMSGANISGEITGCVNNGNVHSALAEKSYAGGVSGQSSDGTRLSANTNWGEVCNANFSGGIVGSNGGGCVVSDCKNAGVVSYTNTTVMMTAEANAGGIAGVSSGTIELSRNVGSVVGAVYSGGIAGSAEYVDASSNIGTINGNYAGGICGFSAGELLDCTNDGDVVADLCAGGIVGYIDHYANEEGKIYGCVNNGYILNTLMKNGENTPVAGGIAGRVNQWSYGFTEISGCMNAGKVESDYYSGGICGEMYSHNSISASCNTGAIYGGTADGAAGGIAGNIWGAGGQNAHISLTSCYNTGEINGSANKIGDMCGIKIYVDELNCYWLDDSHTGDIAPGGITSTQMQSLAMHLNREISSCRYEFCDLAGQSPNVSKK